MKMFILLLQVVLFSSVLANVNDPIVATVNGVKIYKSTLMSYHTQNLNFISSFKKVTVEESLNDLVNRIIGIAKAKKEKIDQQPEVLKKMNDIVYHAKISKDLEPKLRKINVTEKDIESYYKKFPEYKTSQILLRLKSSPSQEDVNVADVKINTIYKELIRDPSKFEELAKVHGQTTGAITGGDLGYQPKTRLSPEYFEAIDGKKVGFTTKPFKTQYGLHIVKITGKKTYKQIDKRLYNKIVYDTKRDSIMNDYFAAQRKSADIKIYKSKL